MSCRYAKKRKLVRDAYARSGRVHVLEMYERYERERIEGKRQGDRWWRIVVRQEVKRIKRLGT